MLAYVHSDMLQTEMLALVLELLLRGLQIEVVKIIQI
jgi:hypothetical protein